MTSTLTRPAAAESAAGADASPPAGMGADTWLTTGDHKRLGRLFLAGGLAAIVAGCVTAFLFQLPDGPDAHFWTAPGSRLTSITAAAALVIGIPALWIGLATYVVPLQIGATRLALPRLHNLALWIYFAGGVLVTIGFLADHAPLNSLASSAPAVAAEGSSAEDVTELVIAGLFLVGVAILLAAVSLLTTVLNRRTEGMRLEFLPLFSWSTLGTATTLVLAAPVFLAGLAILFYDQHYGGTLFADGAPGRRIWQHQLWLLGQPLGLVFAAAGVGIFGDVVAGAARRPLAAHGVARAAAVAAPLLTLLLWAGDLSVLRSPFGPVATAGGMAAGVPLALALLTWLATFKGGRPQLRPGLLFVPAFLLLVGLATAASLAAVAVGVEGGDAEAFRNGQITLLMFGAPVVALAGGLAHWTTKIRGHAAKPAAAALQCLLLLGGLVLMAAPAYAIGLGADSSVAPVAAAGSAAVAAGLLLAALTTVVGRRGATAGAQEGSSAAEQGLTLEWATASPPPVHNFDTIPEVRSPYPLADPEAAR